jgi:hypothetical protein
MGPFGALAWDCPFDATATTAAICPESQPDADAACTWLLDAADCKYSQRTACHCSAEMQTWVCFDPAECSKEPPSDDTACDRVGTSCRYERTSCECFTTGWQCTDAT